jgi:putative flavoprotein involved in K+ transport
MKPCQRFSHADQVTTVIIGAGQSGLAASRCLSKRGIDHVLLERGEVANSWRTERWDSLKLLTPNWQTQLPGRRYQGSDSNGYMPVAELVGFLDDYASNLTAPIHCGTTVESLSRDASGYTVATNRGQWHCSSVIIASGAFNIPVVPRCAAGLPKALQALTPHEYRNPAQLAEGGVMVVGASATGAQIADELQRSGRQVTLCAGEHVRMPRRYRGKDILDWMDRLGMLDETWQQVEDIKRARRLPSAQLVGSAQGYNLDLTSLKERGISVVGRLASMDEKRAQFSGSLNNVSKLADLKAQRLLNAIDEWIIQSGRAVGQHPATRLATSDSTESPRLEMDLRSGEIKTVIWACGFRPDYSWLKVPVLDGKGMIKHEGGVCSSPGLYVMGLPLMRRRKSSFIYGAADDANAISAHLAGYLDQQYQSRLHRVA